MLRGEALLGPLHNLQIAPNGAGVCPLHFFTKTGFRSGLRAGRRTGFVLVSAARMGIAEWGAYHIRLASLSVLSASLSTGDSEKRNQVLPTSTHKSASTPPICGGALLQAALSGALGRRRKASAAPIRNTPVLAANDPNGSFVGPSDFSLDRERPVSLFQGKEKWGVHPSSPVWGQNRS